MNGAGTMLGDRSVFMLHFLELMPDLVAVGKSRRRTDVSCYEYLIVPGDDAAGSPAVAGGSLGYRMADFHEVFIPARSYVRCFRVAHEGDCIMSFSSRKDLAV